MPLRPFSLMLASSLTLSLMGARAAPAPQSARARPDRLAVLRRALHRDRFIAYTPLDLDPRPGHLRAATPEGIHRDLKVLRPYFTVLVTYSCNRAQGMDAVVPIAAEEGFRVVLGIWDVRSTDEFRTAIRLAKRYPQTVLAIIAGNETQMFGRAEWTDIEGALGRLRSALPSVPVSTTEPISAYGNEALRRDVDFHAPNIHWAFAGGNKVDVKAAVAWLAERVSALRRMRYGQKPILIKEHGVPSGPAPFSPENQAKYWSLCAAMTPVPDCASTFFEFGDSEWKASELKAQMEQHWGAWDSHGQPKPVAAVLKRIR